MIQDDRDGPLISMDVRDFIMTVGSRSPSPGGGSVSAFAASLVSKVRKRANIRNRYNQAPHLTQGDNITNTHHK